MSPSRYQNYSDRGQRYKLRQITLTQLNHIHYARKAMQKTKNSQKPPSNLYIFIEIILKLMRDTAKNKQEPYGPNKYNIY